MERRGIVTFKGGPMTLVGEGLQTGRPMPDFTVLDAGLNPVRLADLKGRPVIVSVVPSLDTQVCEIQTKRFNQEAAGLGVKVLTISMDLPFAQKRFCDAFKIANVQCLSDYRDRSFAEASGLLIKELGLLTRAVLVLDRAATVAYQQIVPEITDEPDYAGAMMEARKLL